MRATPGTIKRQTDMQVGGGQIRLRPVRPFDQTERASGKVFVQTRIEKFFRNSESIKIKVI